VFTCVRTSRPNLENTVFFHVMACSLLTFPQNFSKIVCDYTVSHSEDRIIIVTTVRSSDLTTTIHLTAGMAMGIERQTLHWSKGEQSHESNPSKSTVSHSVYLSIFPSSQPFCSHNASSDKCYL